MDKFTTVYPMRVNGTIIGSGEELPSDLKGVNYDSLVEKGFITKTVISTPTAPVAVTPVTPVSGSSTKKKITKETNANN